MLSGPTQKPGDTRMTRYNPCPSVGEAVGKQKMSQERPSTWNPATQAGVWVFKGKVLPAGLGTRGNEKVFPVEASAKVLRSDQHGMLWVKEEGTVLNSAFSGVSEVTVKRLQVSLCHWKEQFHNHLQQICQGLSLLPVYQPHPHLTSPSGRG